MIQNVITPFFLFFLLLCIQPSIFSPLLLFKEQPAQTQNSQWIRTSWQTGAINAIDCRKKMIIYQTKDRFRQVNIGILFVRVRWDQSVDRSPSPSLSSREVPVNQRQKTKCKIERLQMSKYNKARRGDKEKKKKKKMSL